MDWDGAGDDELVAAARGGSSAAWDALVVRHAGRVWAMTRSHRLSQADAEDVSQVTWLRLVTHLDTIREADRVGAWLATTARHECLRVLRKAGRQLPVGEDDELEPREPDRPAVDAGLIATERQVALWRAIEQLGSKCRQLLRVLMADPEPTYAEVSATLDMPIGSIGPNRGRCLRQLRAKLSGITDDDEGSSV